MIFLIFFLIFSTKCTLRDFFLLLYPSIAQKNFSCHKMFYYVPMLNVLTLFILHIFCSRFLFQQKNFHVAKENYKKPLVSPLILRRFRNTFYFNRQSNSFTRLEMTENEHMQSTLVLISKLSEQGRGN